MTKKFDEKEQTLKVSDKKPEPKATRKFVPEPSITAYELASLLALKVSGITDEAYAQLPPELQRHFQEV